jgi:hypothetical protein
VISYHCDRTFNIQNKNWCIQPIDCKNQSILGAPENETTELVDQSNLQTELVI